MQHAAKNFSARPVSAKVAPGLKARSAVVVRYSAATAAESDVLKTQRTLEALANALSLNEVLRKQVLSEGARAAQASRELAKAQAQVKGGAAPVTASTDNDTARRELEAERARVQKLIEEAAAAPRQLEVERQAKVVAEAARMDLENQIKEVTLKLEQQSQKYKEADASEKSATDSHDALEKANQLNSVLKKQLTEQIARAGEAKELAAAKHRELTNTAAKLREQQKALQKLTKDSQAAFDMVKKSKEYVDNVATTQAELKKRIAEETKRAQAAEQALASLKEAQAKIRDQHSKFDEILADAKTIEDVKAILDKTLSSNESLRTQVLMEGQRASKASKEHAVLAALARDHDKFRQQIGTERQARLAVQIAYSKAVTALQEERKRVQEIIAEAGPALENLESERSARAAAEKLQKSLEVKLGDATLRLERTLKTLKESEAKAKADAAQAKPQPEASMEDEEKLAKANALIATLTNQLRGEIARGHAAKDLAAQKYKELTQAQSKLKDEQGKLKMASKDTTQFFEQARKDQAALQAVTASQEELKKRLEADAKRAAEAEAQAAELKAALQKGGVAVPEKLTAKASTAASGLDSGDEDAQLAWTLKANDVLYQQVVAEGKRAAKTSRDLASAHSRIAKAEKGVPQLKAEIAGMRDTMVTLQAQMKEIQATKGQRERERLASLDAKLTATEAELRRSQQEAVAARRVTDELKETYEVTKSRVSLLEREVAEKQLEVSRK